MPSLDSGRDNNGLFDKKVKKAKKVTVKWLDGPWGSWCCCCCLGIAPRVQEGRPATSL